MSILFSARPSVYDVFASFVGSPTAATMTHAHNTCTARSTRDSYQQQRRRTSVCDRRDLRADGEVGSIELEGLGSHEQTDGHRQQLRHRVAKIVRALEREVHAHQRAETQVGCMQAWTEGK